MTRDLRAAATGAIGLLLVVVILVAIGWANRPTDHPGPVPITTTSS